MHWVRLVPIANQQNADAATIAASQVTFEVTPQLSESRTVNYSTIEPIHIPGGILVYKGTSSRTFALTAKFVSRNAEDANRNRIRLQLLRAWLLPYFGATDTLSTLNVRARQLQANSGDTLTTLTPEERTAEARTLVQQRGSQLRGAPPDILYFYAYSTEATGSGTRSTANLNRIPVVLSNLEIQYPDDVDYIPIVTPSGATEPFPVRMNVSFTLLETHSPRDYERFDLTAFKQGTLVGF